MFTLLTRVPASLVLGTKTGADIGDGTCEPGLASPASYLNPLPVLHLVEDLRLSLQTLERPQERAALLSQIPGPTAAYIKEWFEGSLVSRPGACLGSHWRTSLQSPRNATIAWGCYFICPPSSLFLLPTPCQHPHRVVLPRRRVEPSPMAQVPQLACLCTLALLLRKGIQAREQQTWKVPPQDYMGHLLNRGSLPSWLAHSLSLTAD